MNRAAGAAALIAAIAGAATECPYCGGAAWCPGVECGGELDEPPRTHPYGVVIPDTPDSKETP